MSGTAEAGVRWDHAAIYDLIPAGVSVLDLGCGDGGLLDRLIREKKADGLGVEKDLRRVLECVQRGVPVYHADLDEGLRGFPDRFFDCVVLEKTLQAVHQPLRVLGEMLRVGRVGIVSFPNFGCREVVESLARTGRMPVTPELPHQWHDTPNIHLFTVADFLDWVNSNEVAAERGLAWTGEGVRELENVEPGLVREALFVLASRRTGG